MLFSVFSMSVRPRKDILKEIGQGIRRSTSLEPETFGIESCSPITCFENDP